MTKVKVLTEPHGKQPGKPRVFADDEEFYERVASYIIKCENEYLQFPNISGFCVWMGIHRGTFYDQRTLYPDTYKKVQEMFENASINSKHASDTMKIFYMRNKFGYTNSDTMNVAFDAPLQVNVNFDNLSLEELQTLKNLTAKAEKVK